jgi:hypothetical protein
MKFAIIHSTQAAMPITSFGSCQAVRKIAEIHAVIARAEVTPEWLAMNEAKQREFESGRARYRDEHPEIKK